MKVYICGPMSGIEDYNFPAFNAAEAVLTAAGHQPITPVGPLVDGWEWADYMRRAVGLMLTADAVALLDEWESSTGAGIEYALALDLGIPTDDIDGYLGGGA